MLNVKTLTDTMSRMPLPQLQQYAALHKNDPYIVTLALSIANQKKQMMASKDGQAGMQPQPKVVDQDIFGIPLKPQPRGAAPQQALPEDQGIGQLPAPNMQNMAEGGIVAFDDGGSVPGYAGGVFTGEEDMPEWLKAFPPESGIRKTYRAAKQYDKNNPMPVYTAPAAAPALPPSATQVMSGLPNTTPPPSAGAVSPSGAAPATTKPVAPTTVAKLPGLNTEAPTAAEAKTEAAKLSDSSKLQSALQGNEDFITKAYDKLLGDYDKKISEVPEAYKGYEERLKKEEAEAATDKDKALGMSIFQAGLSMMAGSSQYAFENIGKGALIGLDNYQSALKDLKKAQRERDKAFGDIETARNAEKRGDIKAKTEIQAKGIEALGTAKNHTVDAFSKIFQVDTETARGIFDLKLKEQSQNLRSIYEQNEATKRTQIQANAPTGLERIYRNPKLFKKHMEAQTAATGMRGDTAHRETWAKSPYLQTQYPKIDDYLRAMGIQPTVEASGADRP